MCFYTWETKQKVYELLSIVLSVVDETETKSVYLALRVSRGSKIGTNNRGTLRWMGKADTGERAEFSSAEHGTQPGG